MRPHIQEERAADFFFFCLLPRASMNKGTASSYRAQHGKWRDRRAESVDKAKDI